MRTTLLTPSWSNPGRLARSCPTLVILDELTKRNVKLSLGGSI